MRNILIFFPKWFKFLWSISKSCSYTYVGNGCFTFQVCGSVPLWTQGGLPEGVSEVNTPSLQLLRVVGRHVGEFSEDVEVRGVSWWSKGGERKREVKMKIDVTWGPSAKIWFARVWLVFRNAKQSSDILWTPAEVQSRKWRRGKNLMNGAGKTGSFNFPKV